jgi:hypothetical protein
MGNHIDTRSRRNTVREHDELARKSRTTFKQHLRDIEEELLEDEDFTVDEIEQDQEQSDLGQ